MTFLEVTAILIVVAAAISGVILIHGQRPWNRLLGYNLVAGKVTIAIVVIAAATRNTFYLDIAVVYALLSFIGVTALSDYLVEQRGNGFDSQRLEAETSPESKEFRDAVD
jgi:multicomponent Na+:H+ antiporter subunit F